MAKIKNKRVSQAPIGLSANEIRILKYIYKEKSNAEMAALLGKSIRTVEGYRKSLSKKRKHEQLQSL